MLISSSYILVAIGCCPDLENMFADHRKAVSMLEGTSTPPLVQPEATATGEAAPSQGDDPSGEADAAVERKHAAWEADPA